MKKYLILITLLFAAVCETAYCNPECEVTQANSEAECSSIVEGVNTITGSYSFTVPIHHVPGAHPITFYKSFNSHDHLFEDRPFWSESFCGFLKIEEKEIDNVGHYHAFYVEDGGASTFLIQPRNKLIDKKYDRNICLKLSHEYSRTRGVTNTARGAISAATNMSNMKIEMSKWGDKDPKLTKADGTIQHFQKYAKVLDRYGYKMMEQIFPNGNRCLFSYKKDPSYILTGATFTNADQSQEFLTYSYKDVSYDKSKHLQCSNILFSDGGKVVQNFLQHRGLFRGEIKPFYCLQEVHPIGAPGESYTYWSYCRLSKRSKEERYVEIEYYDEGRHQLPGKEVYLSKSSPQIGRVKKLKAPAGTSADPITIYSFDYFVHRENYVLYQGDTLVTDGNGNCKRYIYDKNHRLTDINHMGKNTKYLPYRQNIFSWSRDGRLQYTHFNDQTGHCIHYKRFDYDRGGNVLKRRNLGLF